MGGSCCTQSPGQESFEKLPDAVKNHTQDEEYAATVKPITVEQPAEEPVVVGESTKIKEFLGQVPLLSSMGPDDIQQLANALVSESFTQGSVIIQQGDVGDKFYLLEEGKCVVTKVDNTAESAEAKEVAAYSRGDAFGELALLNDKPRAATITATTDVTVLSLTQDTFRRLIGPMLDKDIDAMYGESEGKRKMTTVEVVFKVKDGEKTVPMRRRPLGMTIDKDFKVQKVQDRSHAYRQGVQTGWVMLKLGEHDVKDPKWTQDNLFQAICDAVAILPDTSKGGKKSGRRSLLAGNLEL